jgi:transposase-like protein
LGPVCSYDEYVTPQRAQQVDNAYLNNIVEQEHRGVKRITRPMLGLKSFDTAQYTLAGIELMHMLRKGQIEEGVEPGLTSAQRFCALAA